jgi:hypothetical protein
MQYVRLPATDDPVPESIHSNPRFFPFF